MKFFKIAKIVSLIIIICLCGCSDDESTDYGDINFKEEMRDFVIGISNYANSIKGTFFIVPQNGIELVTSDGEEEGALATYYLNAIDGHGQEDLFYGYINDDQPTSASNTEYLRVFLDKSRAVGNVILVTDYCSTPGYVDDSYSKNSAANYVSFAADHRELDNIPGRPAPIYSENNIVVVSLNQVKNFLYLINPENYSTKTNFINAITATNYDLLIMDYFFQDGGEFLTEQIEQLKQKANGGQRLLLAYMSIGEAEDYRYYWQESWNNNKPDWIAAENPEWKGNYKVKYWENAWQSIIYGNDDSYLKKIIDAGFDGVYLDIIDAFEYFENL
jgi:cysteinyl-tRNA synthetase